MGLYHGSLEYGNTPTLALLRDHGIPVKKVSRRPMIPAATLIYHIRGGRSVALEEQTLNG